jgi:hypothetical protein
VRIVTAILVPLLTCLACSSSPSPGEDAGSSSTMDASGPLDAAPEAAPACVKENQRVPKGPEGTCCDSLVKACVDASSGNLSPCICSKVACVAAPETPPPNVPCCPGARTTDCAIDIPTSNVQCTCGL